MSRRCTSESCILAAQDKGRVVHLDLPVAAILHQPARDWKRVALGSVRIASDRNIEVDWNKYNVDDFLFTHCTIVSSVSVAENGYYIEPPCDELVNSNGNAWSTPVLVETFRSFVGAQNYYEHIQVPECSKGRIMDAVLRPVIYAGKDGKNQASVYYVDILVGTERRHSDLVRRIEAGEMNTMSMGCGLAGTSITLPNSETKFIEDIEVGDVVLTHVGRARHVTSLYKQQVKAVPLYSVDYVTGNQPLRLTGEHPVLIIPQESIRCVYDGVDRPCKIDSVQSQCFYSKNLSSKCAGKKKPCGRDKENYDYNMEFVPISQLREGDYLVKAIRDEEVDDEQFTDDVCRLFGLYVGDGYIGWNWLKKEKKTPVFVEWCLSENEVELHDEIENILGRILPEAKVVKRHVPERSGYYIKVWDNALASLFYEHGDEGAWNKKLSDTVMLLPKVKQKLVVSGMMDTDGCFYEKTSQLSYSTASRVLFEQLHMLLLRLRVENYPSVVSRRPSGFKQGCEMYDQYMIQISVGSSWKVRCNKNKCYGKEPDMSNQLCFFYRNYYLCPIKNITEVSVSATVYNFSVEEDESYCVDQLAVHNCVAHIVQCSKCGKEISDSMTNCIHLDQQMMDYFVDKNGVRRIVAELCGRSYLNDKGERVGDPNSLQFIEASWVERPAFTGAVINHFISELPKYVASMSVAADLSDMWTSSTCDLNKLRVADANGMMVLRLAREEIMRQQQLVKMARITERVSRSVVGCE